MLGERLSLGWCFLKCAPNATELPGSSVSTSGTHTSSSSRCCMATSFVRLKEYEAAAVAAEGDDEDDDDDSSFWFC